MELHIDNDEDDGDDPGNHSLKSQVVKVIPQKKGPRTPDGSPSRERKATPPKSGRRHHHDNDEKKPSTSTRRASPRHRSCSSDRLRDVSPLIDDT
jgi:hypothetical protein